MRKEHRKHRKCVGNQPYCESRSRLLRCRDAPQYSQTAVQPHREAFATLVRNRGSVWHGRHACPYADETAKNRQRARVSNATHKNLHPMVLTGRRNVPRSEANLSKRMFPGLPRRTAKMCCSWGSGWYQLKHCSAIDSAAITNEKDSVWVLEILKRRPTIYLCTSNAKVVITQCYSNPVIP